MNQPHIILASQSPRRAKLLQEAGYSIHIVPSAADELDATADTVQHIVTENACRKGRAVLQRLRQSQASIVEHAVLVAADTLVTMGGTVYSKPIDYDQAEQFLTELGGQPHQVLTGVYLYFFDMARDVSFFDTTHVTLKAMSSAEIRALFQRVDPLDKAGGYGFQDSAEIVARMEGSPSNVIGLPMEMLQARLKQERNET